MGRSVARAETGPAEGIFHHSARSHKFCRGAVVDQRQPLRLTGGIDRQAEGEVAGAFAVQNGGGKGDVFKAAASAARNDALIDPQAAVADFAAKVESSGGVTKLAAGFVFYMGQQFGSVPCNFGHGVGVAGVEGQSDHGDDLAKVNANKAVIGRRAFKAQFGVVVGAAVFFKIAGHLGVCCPDGRKTGGFGGHDVDAATVFYRKALNAGAHKFQHLVLHKAIAENSGNKGQRHVLRANTGARRAFEPDGYFLRVGHVIGLAEQLLDQFRPAFAHSHDTQRAIAGMAV